MRISSEVENATIVAIICDRGDRYLQPVFLTTRAGLSFAIDASAWLSRVAIPLRAAGLCKRGWLNDFTMGAREQDGWAS